MQSQWQSIAEESRFSDKITADGGKRLSRRRNGSGFGRVAIGSRSGEAVRRREVEVTS